MGVSNIVTRLITTADVPVAFVIPFYFGLLKMLSLEPTFLKENLNQVKLCRGQVTYLLLLSVYVETLSTSNLLKWSFRSIYVENYNRRHRFADIGLMEEVFRTN